MRIIKIITVVLLLFIITGCMLPGEEGLLPPVLLQPDKIVYITAEVERGTIKDILEDFVTVASSAYYDVYFETRSWYLYEMNFTHGMQVKAGDVLARLDTGSLEIDIQRQRIEVRKRQLSLDEITNNGGSDYIRMIAELDLELAELYLQQMEEEFEKSVLIAPADGVIAYKSSYGIGEFVPARSIICTIADTSLLHFEYTGSHVHRLRPGMETVLIANNLEISAAVTMTPDIAPAEIRPDLRNTVIFSAIDPYTLPENLGRGMRLKFSILMEEREDTIIIPSGIIYNFMGGYYVHVLENGIRMERDVEIGLLAPGQVEILNGLSEGELLIIGVEQ